MPILGEIKRARDIAQNSKDGYGKFIWATCEECGKQRWVQLENGMPRSKLCRACASPRNARPVYGINHPKWGGGIAHCQGYVYILKPEHPRAQYYHGYVNRARLVLEEKLGRYLLDGCEPHHINGIKNDDHPENLVELSHSEHARLPISNPLASP